MEAREVFSGRKGFHERGLHLWNDTENRVHWGTRCSLGLQGLRACGLGNRLVGLSNLRKSLHLCFGVLV